MGTLKLFSVRGPLVKNVYVRRSREGQEDLGQGTQGGKLTEAVREEEREWESSLVGRMNKYEVG